MPATPTATPPTNIRKNLFNQRSIKETHAENNLEFSFFYLEALWSCYGFKVEAFWWRAPNFVCTYRDYDARQLPS